MSSIIEFAKIASVEDVRGIYEMAEAEKVGGARRLARIAASLEKKFSQGADPGNLMDALYTAENKLWRREAKGAYDGVKNSFGQGRAKRLADVRNRVGQQVDTAYAKEHEVVRNSSKNALSSEDWSKIHQARSEAGDARIAGLKDTGRLLAERPTSPAPRAPRTPPLRAPTPAPTTPIAPAPTASTAPAPTNNNGLKAVGAAAGTGLLGYGAYRHFKDKQ